MEGWPDVSWKQTEQRHCIISERYADADQDEECAIPIWNDDAHQNSDHGQNQKKFHDREAPETACAVIQEG